MTTPKRGAVSEGFASDLLKLLRKRENLSPSDAARALARIEEHIVQYRSEAGREPLDQEHCAAVRAWMTETATCAETLAVRIGSTDCPPTDGGDPLTFPSYLAWGASQRAALTRLLLKLRTDAQAMADFNRPLSHRQADVPRRALELKVADALDLAGVRVTTASGDLHPGTFARVLQLVHAEAGVAGDISLSRSVREACAKLPEWRALRTLPELTRT